MTLDEVKEIILKVIKFLRELGYEDWGRVDVGGFCKFDYGVNITQFHQVFDTLLEEGVIVPVGYDERRKIVKYSEPRRFLDYL